MPRLLTLLTLAATVSAASAQAQVYPERIRSITRARVDAPRVERYQRADREEQTERFTRTLRIGANGQLDVSNISGDIVVTKGGGNEVTIEVVKTARSRSAEDARELLQLVQVEITERGSRAEVRTRYPSDEMRRHNRRNVNVSVAYNISAPAGTQVTAKSVSGNITTRDIRGEISLESVSGNIQIGNGGRVANAKSVSGNVEISGAELDGVLDASSVSGNVMLRKVKARRLDLGSVSGNIVVEDVECDRVEAQSVSGDVNFSGALASGGRYRLRSHSGEIRIGIGGKTGFELDANSFSGSVRSDLPITLQGADRTQDRGRRPRALHGVYGDGSAILDVVTFSGNIVISRR